MKFTDYSHKTLLQHSREEAIPENGPAPGVAELESLRDLLERSSDTPPLPELNRERILAAGRAARLRRAPWHGLAAAAAVALLLAAPNFAPRTNHQTETASVPAAAAPAVTPAAPEEPNPLAQDFLLTELDLLDMQLQELRDTAWFDTALVFLEDTI